LVIEMVKGKPFGSNFGGKPSSLKERGDGQGMTTYKGNEKPLRPIGDIFDHDQSLTKSPTPKGIMDDQRRDLTGRILCHHPGCTNSASGSNGYLVRGHKYCPDHKGDAL
jgi:hypothetical protein